MFVKRCNHNKHFMATADDKDRKHHFYTLKLMHSIVDKVKVEVLCQAIDGLQWWLVCAKRQHFEQLLN